MLDADIKFEPQSWRTAGAHLSDVAEKVTSEFERTLAETGNPAACGATGNNLLDGCLQGIIPAYQNVAREWLTDLTNGLISEGDAMRESGDLYEQTEESNTDASTDIVDGLA